MGEAAINAGYGDITVHRGFAGGTSGILAAVVTGVVHVPVDQLEPSALLIGIRTVASGAVALLACGGVVYLVVLTRAWLAGGRSNIAPGVLVGTGYGIVLWIDLVSVRTALWMSGFAIVDGPPIRPEILPGLALYGASSAGCTR